MLRGDRRARRPAPLPARWGPRRRVLLDRSRRPVHASARHKQALGPDHGCARREHVVLPGADGLRRPRGRKEPQPLLPGVARRDVRRCACVARLPRTDRAERRADRPSRRRHGRVARAVRNLRRVAGRGPGTRPRDRLRTAVRRPLRDRRHSRQRDDELRCRCGGHPGRDRGGRRLRPARRGRGAATPPRAGERAPPPGHAAR